MQNHADRVVYEGMTALDAVGPYEILSRLPGARVTFAGVERRPGPHRHRRAGAGRRRGPGGRAAPGPGPRPRRPRRPRADARTTALHDWLRAVDAGHDLDHVGLHRLAHPRRRRPARRPDAPPRTGSPWTASPGYGVDPVAASAWCSDGKYVTGAGVSAGIDLALHPRRPHRRPRRRPGDPARHRVRPAAPVRGRLPRLGAAGAGVTPARQRPPRAVHVDCGRGVPWLARRGPRLLRRPRGGQLQDVLDRAQDRLRRQGPRSDEPSCSPSSSRSSARRRSSARIATCASAPTSPRTRPRARRRSSAAATSS